MQTKKDVQDAAVSWVVFDVACLRLNCLGMVCYNGLKKKSRNTEVKRGRYAGQRRKTERGAKGERGHVGHLPPSL